MFHFPYPSHSAAVGQMSTGRRSQRLQATLPLAPPIAPLPTTAAAPRGGRGPLGARAAPASRSASPPHQRARPLTSLDIETAVRNPVRAVLAEDKAARPTAYPRSSNPAIAAVQLAVEELRAAPETGEHLTHCAWGGIVLWTPCGPPCALFGGNCTPGRLLECLRAADLFKFGMWSFVTRPPSA